MMLSTLFVSALLAGPVTVDKSVLFSDSVAKAPAQPNPTNQPFRQPVASLGLVGNPFEVPVGMRGVDEPVGLVSKTPMFFLARAVFPNVFGVDDPGDTSSSRVDLALGVTSLSAAMIATGLTASCLAAKTCRELVPLTRWAFDRGPVWGVTGRAAVNGLIHYGVARWVPKGKWRTATLAILAVINVTNAVLDIRTLQKIEQDAGR